MLSQSIHFKTMSCTIRVPLFNKPSNEVPTNTGPIASRLKAIASRFLLLLGWLGPPIGSRAPPQQSIGSPRKKNKRPDLMASHLIAMASNLFAFLAKHKNNLLVPINCSSTLAKRRKRRNVLLRCKTDWLSTKQFGRRFKASETLFCRKWLKWRLGSIACPARPARAKWRKFS